MAHTRPLPDLEAGLTRLAVPGPRSAPFYRLAGAEVAGADGRTLWVDARNHASTRALHDHVGRPGALDDLWIARAFTAYQHHALVRDLPAEADADTDLVVVPAVADLYRDPDVPDHEATRLLEATLTLLAATADSLDVPVLATTAVDDDLADRVAAHADRTVEASETEMGVAYDGPAFGTDVYWREGWWQTTVPYWVDLLGVADEDARLAAGFGELAEVEA